MNKKIKMADQKRENLEMSGFPNWDRAARARFRVAGGGTPDIKNMALRLGSSLPYTSFVQLEPLLNLLDLRILPLINRFHMFSERNKNPVELQGYI